jgi:hypothetical protein
VGSLDGTTVGSALGEFDGLAEGTPDGTNVGDAEGSAEGIPDGSPVGSADTIPEKMVVVLNSEEIPDVAIAFTDKI